MTAAKQGNRGCKPVKLNVFLSTTFLMALLSLPIVALAQITRVRSAVALDGVVVCFRARDPIITATTGPCSKYTPPRQVRVAETFVANGDTKTIKVIVADRAEQDMPELGIKLGQWSRSAAESVEDIPLADENGRTGTWLCNAHCQPTN
jgi:hypothetical protein